MGEADLRQARNSVSVRWGGEADAKPQSYPPLESPTAALQGSPVGHRASRAPPLSRKTMLCLSASAVKHAAASAIALRTGCTLRPVRRQCIWIARRRL
jgi:hypothetical protein